MKARIFIVSLISICCTVFCGCSDENDFEEIQKEKVEDTGQPQVADNDIRLDKELIQQLKTKAVDTLKIESNSFVLDAYLWRDFQPVSPPNGKPMISINRLIDVNSVKIPDNISVVKQYVIYGDSIWISDYENEIRPSQPEYKIEKISRNGPEWGPQIYADVVSQIYDSNTDKTHYLALKNVFIERTD